MNWFKKEENSRDTIKLPDLPKLPELPPLDDDYMMPKGPLPQLPSYPQNSFGEKFSKSAIKEAVSGGKEEKETDAGHFDEEDGEMHQFQNKFQTRGFDSRALMGFPKPITERRNIDIDEVGDRLRLEGKTEPVFVRLDKFNESLKIFENARSKVSEIESLLSDIKRKRNEEERQLGEWEREMQELKNQLENISRNVFSKVR